MLREPINTFYERTGKADNVRQYVPAFRQIGGLFGGLMKTDLSKKRAKQPF